MSQVDGLMAHCCQDPRPQETIPGRVGKTKRAVEVLGGERLLANVVGHPPNVVLELRHDVDQHAARGITVTPVQERDYFVPQIPARAHRPMATPPCASR
jgi:hypothetical protein